MSQRSKGEVLARISVAGGRDPPVDLAGVPKAREIQEDREWSLEVVRAPASR